MITADEKLTDGRKCDIAERVRSYADKHGITLAQIARQLDTSASTVSEVLLRKYAGRADKHLRALNNWMELDARRRNIVLDRQFAEHSVARDIITVAEIVSETCKIGVVFGPAQIGKSFTLAALEGSDRLGQPVLIRMGESAQRPKAVCRMVCAAFGLKTEGTFDALMRRLVKRLQGTRRPIFVDEADDCSYRVLEFLRELHDRTGCGPLLCGKPAIYQKLGFRDVGDFREVTDQLSARVVIRRDLTERTRRTEHPTPLFTKDDIRALITTASLELKVAPSAIDWLQARACVIGMGGFGMAVINLYLAYKFAVGSGATEITAEHLEAVQQTTMGHEDLERMEEVVAESSGTRIRRLA